jgi:glycosyltransferase involved in cell wall biosynthesis
MGVDKSVSEVRLTHPRLEPVTTAELDHHWSIDSINLNGKTFYVCGWFYSPSQTCSSICFELLSSAGELIGSFQLSAGNPRQDVGLIHSQNPQAIHSGFTGLGAWPSVPCATDILRLRCELADGSELLLTIPEERWRAMSTRHPRLARMRIRLAHFRHYGLKAVGLIARGQLGVLRQKVQRQLSEQPSTQIPDANRMLQLAQPTGQERVHLVVDHRLGGGANQYRERLIRQYLDQGDTVLILGFQITQLSLVLTVQQLDDSHHFLVASDTELLSSLREVTLTNIIYNTAVSYASPEQIPSILTTLKRRNGGMLTLLLHDYFMICPSHFLLDKDGAYCGIPDADTCRKCLPVNPHGFTSLFSGNIQQWRAAWKELIKEADKILAFSEASASLLRKAFADALAPDVLQVQPHEVTYLRGQTIEVESAKPLVIGIVGQIGLHKGAEVVRDLAAEIRRQNGTERIAVIGTLETAADKSIVRETGPYRHDNLAEEIRRSGANLMFLPSIWPETFSYVAQEMMELGLPIVCFDLGAPAERIRTYSKGFLLSSRHPAELLQELRIFSQRHYSSPSQSPS